jgi:predicted enzyme related to lactoylglutathione lyase
MRFNKVLAGTSVAVLLAVGVAAGSLEAGALAPSAQTAGTVSVAVGPQYDTTHVYVTPEDFTAFVASFVGTFGGTTTKQGVFTVTPTQSSTMSQLLLTPVGTVSVFGFKTPIPYPFGSERTGYLVTDMDEAVRAAKATGADVIVAPFNDPIGQDAVIQWPGGVSTQLYWHNTAQSYTPLQTIPENRVYVSPDRVDAFVRSFLAFSRGTVVSDDAGAPGVEIGRPAYGRETTGYEVANLAETLTKAKAAGVDVLVPLYKTDEREAVVIRFPGGYIAEIHSAAKR